MTSVQNWAHAGLATLACLAGACGPEDPGDTVCEPQAPYHLMVEADAGFPLPASTTLQVKHGGGESVYQIADPPDPAELVFCEKETSQRLTCDVWSQGAVTVIVDAEGFDPVEETLTLEKERGCVVTRDVEIWLASPGS